MKETRGRKYNVTRIRDNGKVVAVYGKVKDMVDAGVIRVASMDRLGQWTVTFGESRERSHYFFGSERDARNWTYDHLS